MNRYRNRDVIASLFLPAAMVMIFTQLTGVVANIIDGVITSRYLGPDAYSAVSLLGPLVNIILLLASFISIGGQIVCSHQVGKGQREEANAVFTFSAVFGLVIAALFVLLSLFCPELLFQICGVSFQEHPELYDHMMSYLRGYLTGIPAVIMVQVLSPYLVMDNGKKLVTLSAAVLCAADIAGDLLNALVFRLGIFGMGLATSVAMWLQLTVLCIHFIRKTGYFRFSLKALTAEHLKEIVKNGALSFVKKLAVILRDIATNRINLIIAVSTAAVAAKGMQSDLNSLMFCISIGIGRTLLTISSMYYSAADRQGLKRAFSVAMKFCVEVLAVTAVVLFFAAPLLSRIYTSDPEVIDLSVFSIRCMALGLVLDGISEVFQDYLQGIRNRKLVNILCFTERFFIPVGTALILGLTFGTRGIMASVAVGKVLLVSVLFAVICIRNKGIPGNAEGYMFLPDGFGGSAEDNIDAQIITLEDVALESRRAEEFCRAHGVDERKSGMMSLFVEEMAGNIVSHGKPRGKGSVCADYRLYADGGKICLSLRDYCEAFDPIKYEEIHREDSAEKNPGIRMVMKMAKDIRYINTFNSNCLFINMDV